LSQYLLTGVAGFIASKVADLLLSEGHTVIGVDNMNDSYDIRLKEWRLCQLANRPGFEFHHLDIMDRSHMRVLLEAYQKKGIDAVINLAARAGVRQSVADPWAYIDTNVTGTLNLLELCREFMVEKFVLASSSSLYGNNNPMPFREDADTSCPSSPYAASKKGGEVFCHTYHHLYGIDITIFRYFTVYGPASRPDMCPFRFVQRIVEGKPITIYGDGQQSRDFTHVDDIARGTIFGLGRVGFEAINLGSEKPIVVIDVISAIEEMTGRKAILQFRPTHPSDVPATWANIEKARKLLGWSPKVAFQDGIDSMVKWYRKNRKWASLIRTD
jgi:nucleoside-diphosphate-sugar epimerase